MRSRLTLLVCALFLIAAGPVAAQQANEYTASGGAEVKARAQERLDEMGAGCRVTDARIRGVDQVGQSMFEVACRGDDGLLLHDARPPVATPCLMLVGRNAGQECRLPANRGGLRRLREMGREAGVSCRIDQAIVRGDAPEGGRIIEFGCDGEAGAWLRQDGATSVVTPCLIVQAQGGVCEFTSDAEIRATAGRWAREAGADCVVGEARYMGTTDGRRHVELACASGEALVLVLAEAGAPARVMPCVEAANPGGGCRLRSN